VNARWLAWLGLGGTCGVIPHTTRDDIQRIRVVCLLEMPVQKHRTQIEKL